MKCRVMSSENSSVERPSLDAVLYVSMIIIWILAKYEPSYGSIIQSLNMKVSTVYIKSLVPYHIMISFFYLAYFNIIIVHLHIVIPLVESCIDGRKSIINFFSLQDDPTVLVGKWPANFFLILNTHKNISRYLPAITDIFDVFLFVIYSIVYG